MGKARRGGCAQERKLTAGFERLESRLVLSACAPISGESIALTNLDHPSAAIERTPTISWEP
ncbi:MAG: hypothetical protein ACR2NM_12550, partial [Bythopirellula sp.]